MKVCWFDNGVSKIQQDGCRRSKTYFRLVRLEKVFLQFSGSLINIQDATG